MTRAAISLVGLALVWTMAVFTAPLGLASSSRVVSRSAGLVYVAGSVVCHQRPERSFVEAGHPLPVCARCTGLYSAALAGGLLSLVRAAGPIDRGRTRWLLAIASAPTVATWLAEFGGFAHPSNAVRAIAAVPLGLVAAWVVVAMLANDRV